jgi:hypothetical protein
MHGATGIQWKHVADVLQDEPLRVVQIHQPEDVGNKATLRPIDPCGAASLGEVGTWEARGNHVSIAWQRLQLPHVAVDLKPWEPGRENGSRRLPHLTKQAGLVSSSAEADLQAADSGKEARDLVTPPLRFHVGIVTQGTDGSGETLWITLLDHVPGRSPLLGAGWER